MQPKLSGASLVAVVCAAQVLAQVGAYFWPALLPGMIPLWCLTNSEAGWITAIFYGAYVAAVPILVTLTDRVDPQARVPVRRRLHGGGPPAVRPARGRLLVCAGIARPGRRRLGRYLYDGPEAARRPGGREADVARRDRARRKYRCLRRAVFLGRRPAGGVLRLARRLRRGRVERSRGVAAGGAVSAARFAARARRGRVQAVRFPARLPQPLGHGVRDRLLHPHAGDERAARLGRGVPRLRRDRHRRDRRRCWRRPSC